MTFNDLARAARDYVINSFGGGSPRVAHRALTTLAQRMQQVPRSNLSGSVSVKVTYRDGELKNVFVNQDDEAPEVVAF